jgi:hypothetical protein
MSLEITKEKDIFSKLKSSSASVAYDGLLEIRSNITKTKEGYKVLRENEVLKELVNFLHKPNEKILDVTLSILGNCCLDSDCRNEVSTRRNVLLPLPCPSSVSPSYLFYPTITRSVPFQCEILPTQ